MKGFFFKKELSVLLVSAFCICSCTTTVDLENQRFPSEVIVETDNPSVTAVSTADKIQFYSQDWTKVQDVESTVIYVERPVYIPYAENGSGTDSSQSHSFERQYLKGEEAVIDSLKKGTQEPENYQYGAFYYQYNDNFVYEVYCEPYHLTDIQLEPGEVVVAYPLLSENEAVWEITANVGKDYSTGQDIQHFYLKPTFTNLDSTLIIITDRRVYHFRLKSVSGTHMAMVKFNYSNRATNTWAKSSATPNVQGEKNSPVTNNTSGVTYETNYTKTAGDAYLSFDYRIKYSALSKPDFVPVRVYDDGQTTYIELPATVLNKELPILFNEKNEIMNYTIQKNCFVIPRLINTVTLKLGKQSVTVEKKITTDKQLAKQQKAAEETRKMEEQQNAMKTLYVQVPSSNPTETELVQAELNTGKKADSEEKTENEPSRDGSNDMPEPFVNYSETDMELLQNLLKLLRTSVQDEPLESLQDNPEETSPSAAEEPAFGISGENKEEPLQEIPVSDNSSIYSEEPEMSFVPDSVLQETVHEPDNEEPSYEMTEPETPAGEESVLTDSDFGMPGCPEEIPAANENEDVMIPDEFITFISIEPEVEDNFDE